MTADIFLVKESDEKFSSLVSEKYSDHEVAFFSLTLKNFLTLNFAVYHYVDDDKLKSFMDKFESMMSKDWLHILLWNHSIKDFFITENPLTIMSTELKELSQYIKACVGLEFGDIIFLELVEVS